MDRKSNLLGGIRRFSHLFARISDSEQMNLSHQVPAVLSSAESFNRKDEHTGGNRSENAKLPNCMFCSSFHFAVVVADISVWRDNSIFVHQLFKCFAGREFAACFRSSPHSRSLHFQLPLPSSCFPFRSRPSSDLIAEEKDGLQSASFHVVATIVIIIRLAECPPREIKCNDCSAFCLSLRVQNRAEHLARGHIFPASGTRESCLILLLVFIFSRLRFDFPPSVTEMERFSIREILHQSRLIGRVS